MKTLNALLFSADEFAPMVEWARQHEEQFTVEMPAGLAFAPLSEIIYSPSILNATVDGILIANHLNYSEAQILTLTSILRDRHKLLYAVSNGTEPIGRDSSQKFDHKVDLANCIDSPMLRMLANSKEFIAWLYKHGATAEIPVRYADSLKALENTGLVTRRNKSVSLRFQRLRRVLEHEKSSLRLTLSVEDLLSSILVKDKISA